MFACVICSYKSRTKFDPCPKCKGYQTCAPFLFPRLRRLSDVEARDVERFDVGKDWNHALGSGAPGGGVILVASRGGSGKTTEMLRVAARLGTVRTPSIYAFTERTEEELASHAKFVGIDRDRLVTLPIKSVDEALEVTPTGAHLFIDSWGGLEKPDPNDVERIRAIHPSTAWIICHVNKRGEIEGREKLLHAATAVVWVRKKALRTTKNWYGPQCVTPRDLPEAFAPSSGTTGSSEPKPKRKLRAV